MIRFEGVSKGYLVHGQELRAVRDVYLSVAQGEIFGVIGASGAGKSTLIRIANLLEKPDRGKVFVDGKDLTAMTHWELRQARQGIGMIFQQSNLLSSRTVAGNLAFPLEVAGWAKGDIRRRVEELLAIVGLSERANSYPAQLSGGQKQRVGIARALATRPMVLLCDEATSALDPHTTMSILELLKQINTELRITILLVTHEMGVVEAICDRVAVMECGEVVEAGAVNEVFANPRSLTARQFLRPTLGSGRSLSLQGELVLEGVGNA